jgi:hypothetical protein
LRLKKYVYGFFFVLGVALITQYWVLWAWGWARSHVMEADTSTLFSIGFMLVVGVVLRVLDVPQLGARLPRKKKILVALVACFLLPDMLVLNIEGRWRDQTMDLSAKERYGEIVDLADRALASPVAYRPGSWAQADMLAAKAGALARMGRFDEASAVSEKIVDMFPSSYLATSVEGELDMLRDNEPRGDRK